jgi:hypothetical protein
MKVVNMVNNIELVSRIATPSMATSFLMFFGSPWLSLMVDLAAAGKK